ncbi:DNA-directed RNA polymerase subunit beta' [Candidatus Nomurabacteria bacterium RIFCSPHIGHO2_02_FULL_38_15]|uniref:DNA-directed RNA polymerase subunit beta' n=1 Tax=Candidatus Nomurabacteria bacterium RIFCSPHIGHO2_02_FULL_38_15 TaxID=1801752 RepID=A0A1F6VQI3_9BACT|nr:MAG: DNA-directed RNA polymerase subunit beta' [Candidatus Nomurabacteria bacterium RIFCSPHIGHO2_02_FULL_38_15]
MKTIDTTNFDSIVLSLASPEQILEWSFGEVTKPETINYRTSRSERGGLFDEKIFGPEKDYECYCGKYKRIRYAGIICEKCGVEVTRAIVRRERMGHIELASPVAHIWFLKGVPSRMATLLAIPAKDLEKVVYFAGYIIVKVDEVAKEQVLFDLESEFKAKVKTANDEDTKEKLKTMLSAIKKEVGEIQVGKVLNEIQYHHYSLKYAACFEASIGAEAIYNIFKNIDLNKLKEKVELLLAEAGNADREKVQKRLSMIRALLNAGIRPEWMFLTMIPIIPPALRPMVALEGNRHATSDINDLYRRVINRNNRLKKLKEIGAPDVILRNEKRIMQEAVDSLIDNNAGNSQQSAQSQSQKRALKSLSDNLRSKHGLLRQNLLGKRVDYSGRSVIVVGPQLKLNQCGLPKEMALELFRPFVISKILARELAFNIRGANKLIEERDEAVWSILDEVIEGKYVLLNRAPTLHRLSIQAFNPILVEGEAIQLHPLVCTGFNADFDGDQMAVHLPLSKEAQEEAGNLMASNKNLLKPANGEPIGTAKLLDIVLGCYWMTKNVDGEKGEGNVYASPSDALLAHSYGQINYHSKIKVRGTDLAKYTQYENQIFETTVGRILFNEALPETFPFVNEEINSKKVTAIVDSIVIRDGFDAGPLVLDNIKDFGYKYATVSGISWAIDSVKVPEKKYEVVGAYRKLHTEIITQYEDGLLSTEEKYQKVTELWEQCRKEIEKLLPATLDPLGSYNDMYKSGARGSLQHMTQMVGMKGLIQNNQGRTIEFPVIPSYIEGLSPVEYFITTHGSRKGLSDTALNTARAGYLTRRLVDVSQDITIFEEDCGTKNGKTVRRQVISGLEISIAKGLTGRIIHADIVDPATSKVMFKKGAMLSKSDALSVEKAGIETALVRSPLTCECNYGVCQQCYGLDLGRNTLVKEGEAVGIIAGQAIGEPGTQLTLRTFHQGGVVGVDITQGLPRVEEIFERRSPEHPAVISKTLGEVIEVKGEGREKIVTVLSDTKNDGKSNTEEYQINYPRVPIVKPGDRINAGQVLTDGSANIEEIFYYGGKDMAQEYIIHEINKVYEVQGASISPKHCEIIVRQMFSRVRITDSGETSLTPGDITEKTELIEENAKIKALGLKEATGQTVVLGISETAIRTKSWLSAASFQQTNKVLINNALKGGRDPLRGLKENVIVGRLIPAGTGFKKKVK